MFIKQMLTAITAFLLCVATHGVCLASPMGDSENSGTHLLIPLSEAEESDLLFMREEEKLARDVYLTLEDKWGLLIFDNISQSEQRHMDAVKYLLDKYNLPDPVSDESVLGNFVDTNLALFYEELLLRGNESMYDALLVGAEIEEVDIIDLSLVIDRTNPLHNDLVLTYESLACGSRNHLRAFVGHIELLGDAYEPVYLSTETYNEILNSPMERDCGEAHGLAKGKMRQFRHHSLLQ